MAIGTAVKDARKAVGLTQQELANRAGLSRRAIILLEQGGGRVSSLNAVVPELALRLTGLPPGATIADQISRARSKRKMTQAALAVASGLSIPSIRGVETGGGSVASLSAILAILAPEARRRRHPRTSWGTAGDERYTPPEWLHAVEQAFGRISLDPCYSPSSFVQAEACFTAAENGLLSAWSGKLAYVNPPFSDHSLWVKRCADAWRNQEVTTVVALLPFRPDTTAFHQHVAAQADLVVLKGKPRFFNQAQERMSIAPFAAYFAVWGATDELIRQFASSVDGAVFWASGVERVS